MVAHGRLCYGGIGLDTYCYCFLRARCMPVGWGQLRAPLAAVFHRRVPHYLVSYSCAPKLQSCKSNAVE